MPMTVNSGQEGMKRIDRYLALQLAVFVPGGLIIALIGPYALVLLFGEEYAPAYGPLLALMPGILALSCSSILSSYFSAQGRPLVNAMGAVLGLGVGIPAYLAAIPRWGALGAGVASSVCYVAQLCYQWWWYARARAAFGALRQGSG
jgi:O-antigen/teichoic acid export membrane protein